jgi:hypothetical protein
VFPIAEIGSHAAGVRVSPKEFWSIVATYTDSIPSSDIVNAWESIAEDWAKLGVPLAGICNVESVVKEASKCGTLNRLAKFLRSSDETDAIRWLCALLDCLAPYAEQIPNDVISGILPDQEGKLREIRDLSIDLGIDSALKDIAEHIFDPFRHFLLDTRIVPADSTDSRYLLLSSHVGKTMAEGDAVARVIQKLRHALHDKEKMLRSPASADKDACILQTATLAVWLSEKAPVYDMYAKELPLISAGNTLVESSQQPLLLPVEAWGDDAKPFDGVFPETSKLSSLYWTEAGGKWPLLQTALIEWDRCYPALVICEKEIPIKGDLLRKIMRASDLVPKISMDADYICYDCSHIPFLSQAIGRIQKDQERARRFVRFLVNYVVERDKCWRATGHAKRDSSKSEERLTVRPSLWLAHVLRDNWVPFSATGEELTSQVQPNADTLRDLIPWSEVRESLFDFLELFGFDRLELWIHSSAKGDTEREALLRSQLAEIAQVSGEDGLADLRTLLEKRREQEDSVRMNKKFGLLVQELVRDILIKSGKAVDLIDRGYDFAVYEKGGADIETDWGLFEAANYLIEVKATRSNEVRMTSLQAETAVVERERYILCVVDLRDIGDRVPNVDDVSRGARMITGIGGQLEPLVKNVETMWTRRENVRVELSGGLRYCIGDAIWSAGASLEKWAATVSVNRVA